MGFRLNPRALRIPCVALLAIVAPSQVRAQVVIRGIVYDDSSGARLIGAGVMLVDPRTDAPVVNTKTDSVGQFILSARAGVYQLAAVREGYTPVLSAPVPFSDGEQLTIRFPIAVAGDPQHKIGVVEHVRSGTTTSPSRAATPAFLGNFERRRAVGTGLQYDRAQLENSPARASAPCGWRRSRRSRSSVAFPRCRPSSLRRSCAVERSRSG